jgi:hypothetical protein
MQRHRDGDMSDLVRNMIMWIGVVIWLALGYILQNPPGDRYEDTVRDAFTWVLAFVIRSYPRSWSSHGSAPFAIATRN